MNSRSLYDLLQSTYSGNQRGADAQCLCALWQPAGGCQNSWALYEFSIYRHRASAHRQAPECVEWSKLYKEA